MLTIIIIDYGMGNIYSIDKAFQSLGEKTKIVSRPQEIKKSKLVVLPGVGSFGKAMDNLSKRNLIEPLKEYILEEKGVFFGICLGLQLLFEGSQESYQGGFSIFRGKIKRFKKKNLKVPHMGWNKVFFHKKKTNLFKGILEGSSFYFCHSYYAPLNPWTVGMTSYGVKFSSVMERENLVLVQFHPEKSQRIGLKFLKNLLEKCY